MDTLIQICPHIHQTPCRSSETGHSPYASSKTGKQKYYGLWFSQKEVNTHWNQQGKTQSPQQSKESGEDPWQREYDGIQVVGETRWHHPLKERGPILSRQIQRQGLTPEGPEFWPWSLKRERVWKCSGSEKVLLRRQPFWERGRWCRSISWRLGIFARGQEKGESSGQSRCWANGSRSDGMIYNFGRMDYQVHSKQMKRRCSRWNEIR